MCVRECYVCCTCINCIPCDVIHYGSGRLKLGSGGINVLTFRWLERRLSNALKFATVPHDTGLAGILHWRVFTGIRERGTEPGFLGQKSAPYGIEGKSR